jgi:hypothetical protein
VLSSPFLSTFQIPNVRPEAQVAKAFRGLTPRSQGLPCSAQVQQADMQEMVAKLAHDMSSKWLTAFFALNRPKSKRGSLLASKCLLGKGVVP